MAHILSLQQAQMALQPVFRRVDQTTPDLPIDNDDLVEQQSAPAAQYTTNQMLEAPGSGHALTDQVASNQKEAVQLKSRLIIAVDFGTTYSTVSYVKIDPGVDALGCPVGKIQCINNWDHATGNCDARENARAENVPTKLLYIGPKVLDPQQATTDPDPDSDSDDQYVDDEVPDYPTTLFPDHAGRKGRKRGRRPAVPGSRQRPKTIWSRPPGWTVYWGFGVQEMENDLVELAKHDKKQPMDLIKLTLGEQPDEDTNLRARRAELAAHISNLREARIIQDRDNLIYDYLARILRHTKAILDDDGLLEDVEVEYVLCVPVTWSESACRTMHDAMVKAIQACSLDALAQNLIPGLFIVSEPEAAAQFVIGSLGSKGRLRQGEVFIILDAGGGTVDITTYKVTSNELGPLRLEGEAIAPDGALCGSSLITERYLRKMRAKLGELDPTADPSLLDRKATVFANHFDMFDKPRINVSNRTTMRSKASKKKYYRHHIIKLTEEETREIFEPSLKGTTDLLERQLQLAREKKLIINKLIVVGGFGESPSLKARIRQVLSNYYNANGDKIEAIWPKDFPTSAVARGAVLRALDKRNGPSRISRSSFGFLRHEKYGDFPEHKEANVVPQRDPNDQEDYAKNTINWVIQAGQELPSRYRTEPIVSYHTFKTSVTKLVCVEQLYVSQHNHRSHFQRSHAQNQGAELLIFVEVDVSDLKHELPVEELTHVGPRTKMSNRFLRVARFDLFVEIEGKTLKYEARWPPGARTDDEVRIRKSGCASLAPSFAPGVA